MAGFDISERTVSRWMRKAPRSPELEFGEAQAHQAKHSTSAQAIMRSLRKPSRVNWQQSQVETAGFSSKWITSG
jgi:hypothetical protein